MRFVLVLRVDCVVSVGVLVYGLLFMMSMLLWLFLWFWVLWLSVRRLLGLVNNLVVLGMLMLVMMIL